MYNLTNVNKVEMTSNQIAEMTGKEHKIVMRDIRNLIESLEKEIGTDLYPSTYVDKSNRIKPNYILSKDGVMLLITGYSVSHRMKLIKYCNELEHKLNDNFQVPGSFKEALLLAAEQQGEIEQLTLENKKKEEIIIINKPKVGFAETIEKSKSDLFFRDMAKIISNEGIKMGQNKLYDWCRGKGLIFKKSTMPTQTAVDRKLMSVSVDIFDNHENVITKITGKGQIWILDRIKQEIEDGTFYPRTVGQVLTNIKKRYRDDDDVMARKLTYSRPLMDALIKGTCNIPGDLIHQLGRFYKITDVERDDILAAQKRECE